MGEDKATDDNTNTTTAIAEVESKKVASQTFLARIDQLGESSIENSLLKAEAISELRQASDEEFDALVRQYQDHGTNPDWIDSLDVLEDGTHYGRKLGVRQRHTLAKIKAARKKMLSSKSGRKMVDATVAGMTCVSFSMKFKSNGKKRVNASFED